jgi:hypothetical protein
VGAVGLFLLVNGWGWADTHLIEFNGLALNCVAALFACYIYQFLYHRRLSNAHRLMPWLLLAIFSVILYLVEYTVWISVVFWLIIFLYPIGARLNLQMLDL